MPRSRDGCMPALLSAMPWLDMMLVLLCWGAAAAGGGGQEHLGPHLTVQSGLFSSVLPTQPLLFMGK